MERTASSVKKDSITEGIFDNIKKLIIPGFKKGGIVSVDDIEKQVHENGDDGLVSVKNGELIIPKELAPELQKLTEYAPTTPELQKLQKLINLVPVMDNITEKMSKPSTTPKVTSVNNMGNVVNIDTLTLPNVTNYTEFRDKMFREMQKSNFTEGIIKDMSVNRLTGGGKFDKYRHKF